MKNMTAVAKLARLATTPDEMLTGLVRGGAAPGSRRFVQPHFYGFGGVAAQARVSSGGAAQGSSRIVQPHFYAFGGVSATARWSRAVIDGKFEVNPDGGKFAMD